MATIKRQQRAYRRRLSLVFVRSSWPPLCNICTLFDRARALLEGRMGTICSTISRCISWDSVSHVTEPPKPRVLCDFLRRVYLSSRIGTNCASFVHYLVTMNEREKLCELCFASECEFKKKEKSFHDPLPILLFTASCILLHPFEVSMTDYIVFFVLSAGLLDSFFGRAAVRILLLFVTITEWVNTNLVCVLCIVLCKLCFMLYKTGRMTVKESRIPVIPRIQIVNLKREIRWMYTSID